MRTTTWTRRLPFFTLLALGIAAAAAAQSAQAQVRLESHTDRAVREAIKEYNETGVARIIEDGTSVIVPYNVVHPVVKTALLRVTLIELDRNEYVIDRFVGDSLRWVLDFGVTGTRGNFRQIISVRPRDQDVTTSLVLTTNFGRIYQFTLDSEPYDLHSTTNPTDIPFTKHVRFYYPDGPALRMEPPEEAVPGPSPFPGSMEAIPHAARREFIDIANLNTTYQVKADPQFPCVPSFVGDDGTRLFIQFPDATEDPLCATRFPLFFVDEGEEMLVNYEVFGGNTYVAEMIPVEARIRYVTSRKDEREVRIINVKLSERLRERRGSLRDLRETLNVGVGGGVSLPTTSETFRESYNLGYNAGAEIGFELSSRFLLSFYGQYNAFGLDSDNIRGTVQRVVSPRLAQDLEDELARRLSAIDEELEDEVVVFSSASGGSITDYGFGLRSRYLLSSRGSTQPYLGAKTGIVYRQTEPLNLSLAAQLQSPRGNAAAQRLLNEILRDYAGDPLASPYAELLGNPLQDGDEVPDWLLAAPSNQWFFTAGLSIGLLKRVGPRAQVFLEALYDVTLTDRDFRAYAPFTVGLLLDV